MGKLIGPEFSTHTAESFYSYVKGLYKPKLKKETKNASTDPKPRKKRSAKKDVEVRENAIGQIPNRDELLVSSNNSGMLTESSIPLIE